MKRQLVSGTTTYRMHELQPVRNPNLCVDCSQIKHENVLNCSWSHVFACVCDTVLIRVTFRGCEVTTELLWDTVMAFSFSNNELPGSWIRCEHQWWSTRMLFDRTSRLMRGGIGWWKQMSARNNFSLCYCISAVLWNASTLNSSPSTTTTESCNLSLWKHSSTKQSWVVPPVSLWTSLHGLGFTSGFFFIFFILLRLRISELLHYNILSADCSWNTCWLWLLIGNQ